WQRLGQEQSSAGQSEAARKSLEQARVLIDALVDANRQVVQYMATQGHVYHSLARWHQVWGTTNDTLALYERARVIRTELVKGQANDLNYQAELAATLQQLGTMLRAG